ncbi:MAG TPA: hypothetical protein VFO10_15655 [Oligoflexus sp.]|uniref:hypothetical protein n=1 Tax=Oligoflexus sp. TaxID=1971216 RepID=UPI002D805A86|nr:hypothetical protein [Oligoflexus sp.]HET9238697.1 hypothetical protein [Oligoflexus sp.]
MSEILCGVEDAMGSGVTTLAKRRDSIWSFIPLKEVSDLGRNFQVYEDSKGALWIYGNSKAYRLQMGMSSWEELIIKDESRLLEDRDGIVWMVSNGQVRETTSVQRLDGKGFVEVTLPPVTQELRDQFHLSPAGVLTFGRFVWSPKINGWEALPYPSDIVEAPQTYYPLYDNRGQVWWFDNYGITGLLNGSRVRIPLNIYGLSCYDESTPCSVSITGEKTLTLSALRVSDSSYGTYVFQVNSLSAFSLEDMGLPSTKDFYSVWSSPGIPMELNFNYYKGPLFGLRDGVWKPTTKVELPVASFGYRAPDGSVFLVSGSKIFVSREDGPWEPVVYPEEQASAPGTGDFQTWRDMAFYTRKGGGHVLIARDAGIFSVPYSGQLLFPLDDGLWGTDGQGFVGYKDLSFSQKYRIDYSDFDMKFEDVFSAVPLMNDWIYAIVRIQDAYQKTILNVKSGKVLPLKVPLEEVTEISKVIPFEQNSSLVLTIRGIFQVDHKTGKWTLLPFSKDLINEWGMISISNMYLDERKRLWMHGGGMFMRFDFGRPELAFP